MPMRGARICGCSLKIAAGEACPCERRRAEERRKRAEAARPSARDRGYTTKWERERKAYLEAHPYCTRDIGGRACGRPATVVHHLTPHRGDRKLFWSRSNWAPRCTTCHNRGEQSAEKGGRR